MAKDDKGKGKAKASKAPAPAGEASAAADGGGDGGGGLNKILLMLMVLLVVPFSLPTLLVLFVGLLPTLVAAFVEREPPRMAWMCVGGLNFISMLPWLLTMWFGNHTLSHAMELVSSIPFLLAAYVGAGVGTLLYFVTPRIYRLIIIFNAERKMVRLGLRQRQMVDLWGDSIAHHGSGHAPAGGGSRLFRD